MKIAPALRIRAAMASGIRGLSSCVFGRDCIGHDTVHAILYQNTRAEIVPLVSLRFAPRSVFNWESTARSTSSSSAAWSVKSGSTAALTSCSALRQEIGRDSHAHCRTIATTRTSDGPAISRVLTCEYSRLAEAT